MPHPKIHVTHVSPALENCFCHFRKTKQTNNLLALLVQKCALGAFIRGAQNRITLPNNPDFAVGVDACPTPSARFR
jgi:hypothetical protein